MANALRRIVPETTAADIRPVPVTGAVVMGWRAVDNDGCRRIVDLRRIQDRRRMIGVVPSSAIVRTATIGRTPAVVSASATLRKGGRRSKCHRPDDSADCNR